MFRELHKKYRNYFARDYHNEFEGIDLRQIQIDALFWGGAHRWCFGGGEEGTKTQVQQTSPYTQEQKDWLAKGLELYGPTMGQGVTSFPGERVAGFAPTQQAALGQVGGFLDSFGAGGEIPLFGETGEALRKTLAGETGAQPITPEQTAAFFKGTIEDPARYSFAQDYMPAVKEAYSGPGYWGSARSGAQAEASGDLWRYLGEQRTGLDWNTMMANRAAEEARAGRMLSATGAGMAYGGIPTQEARSRLAGLGGAFQFAGAEKQQRQAEINAAMQKFAEQQQITDPQNLSILMSFLGMDMAGTTRTQTSREPYWDWQDWAAFGGEVAGFI